MKRGARVAMGALALALTFGLGYAVRASASGIPAANALTYSGTLDDGKQPIEGKHNLQVIFWDAASAGLQLCQSSPGVSFDLVRGQFTIPLPDACTSAVQDRTDVWVSVLVDGSDTGRAKLGAAPYAVEAAHAVEATHAVSATSASAIAATSAHTSTTCAAAPGVANAIDCQCAVNEFAIGGGAYCDIGDTLRESRSATANTWRLTCSSGAPHGSHAVCLSVIK